MLLDVLVSKLSKWTRLPPVVFFWFRVVRSIDKSKRVRLMILLSHKKWINIITIEDFPEENNTICYWFTISEYCTLLMILLADEKKTNAITWDEFCQLLFSSEICCRHDDKIGNHWTFSWEIRKKRLWQFLICSEKWKITQPLVKLAWCVKLYIHITQSKHYDIPLNNQQYSDFPY